VDVRQLGIRTFAGDGPESGTGVNRLGSRARSKLLVRPLEQTFGSRTCAVQRQARQTTITHVVPRRTALNYPDGKAVHACLCAVALTAEGLASLAALNAATARANWV
jgi:hypothetical protein